jgi:hypothetical protein
MRRRGTGLASSVAVHRVLGASRYEDRDEDRDEMTQELLTDDRNPAWSVSTTALRRRRALDLGCVSWRWWMGC